MLLTEFGEFLDINNLNGMLAKLMIVSFIRTLKKNPFFYRKTYLNHSQLPEDNQSDFICARCIADSIKSRV